MELSDSLGMPLYFEASPSTYRLYEKMGYETLEEKVVHAPELMGTEEPVEVPLMVKMPRAAGGDDVPGLASGGIPGGVREGCGGDEWAVMTEWSVKTKEEKKD